MTLTGETHSAVKSQVKVAVSVVVESSLKPEVDAEHFGVGTNSSLRMMTKVGMCFHVVCTVPAKGIGPVPKAGTHGRAAKKIRCNVLVVIKVGVTCESIIAPKRGAVHARPVLCCASSPIRSCLMELAESVQLRL